MSGWHLDRLGHYQTLQYQTLISSLLHKYACSLREV
jgi:predicted DNA binding CopG/RHH family protein